MKRQVALRLARACFGLQRLRHRVQNVAHLVEPAALFTGRAEHLAQGVPEAERAIANGQVRGLAQAAALQVQQQFAPALAAFTVAVHKAQNVLVAPLVGADNHQHALLVGVHARLETNPVGPEIHIAFRRQVAPAPAFVFGPPFGLQPRDRARCQARRIRAQKRGQGLAEITCGRRSARSSLKTVPRTVFRALLTR